VNRLVSPGRRSRGKVEGPPPDEKRRKSPEGFKREREKRQQGNLTDPSPVSAGIITPVVLFPPRMRYLSHPGRSTKPVTEFKEN